MSRDGRGRGQKPGASSFPIRVLLLALLLALPRSSLAQTQEDRPGLEGWTDSWRLDESSGLPDADVECVLIEDSRLFAGTASGLFVYDGLEWDPEPAFVDTVRWLARVGDELWAAGAGGLWRSQTRDLDFRLDLSAPALLRTGLVEESSVGRERVWLGGDGGLFLLESIDGSHAHPWRTILDDVPVRSLAHHSYRGLLVGTFGDGLRVVRGGSVAETLRSPSAGVTDTLAGNYVHDIEVDEAGDVHIATSWGQLAPRHVAYEHAVDKGLVTERDPHDFLRAAYNRWGPEGWEVTYLFQNYNHEYGHRNALAYPIYCGDPDGDGRQEIWIYYQVQRALHPQGVVCFDVESGEQEWSLLRPNQFRAVIPFVKDGDLLFLLIAWANDWGSWEGSLRDDSCRLLVVDGAGRIRWSFDTERSWVASHCAEETYTELSPTREPIYIHAADPDHEREVAWRFDPGALEMTSISPVLSAESATSFYVQWKNRRLALVNHTDEPMDPRLLLMDLDSGEVVAAASADSLLPDSSLGDGRAASLSLDAEGDWQVLVTASPWLAIWSEEGVTRWRMDQLPDGHTMWTTGFLPTAGPMVMSRSSDYREILIWTLDAREPNWPPRPAPMGFMSVAQSPAVDWPAGLQALDDLHVWARLQLQAPSSLRYQVPAIAQPFLNPNTGRIGWVEAASNDGDLILRESGGGLLGRLRLPFPFRDAQDLMWAAGPLPANAGEPVPLLLDRSRYPFTIRAVDLKTRTWGTEYVAMTGFRDRGATAITTLLPESGLIGTEFGARSWSSPTTPHAWQPQDTDRVRGLSQRGRGRALAHGERGIVEHVQSAVTWQSGVAAMARAPEGLVVVAGDSVRVLGSGRGLKAVQHHVTNPDVSQVDETRALTTPDSRIWMQQLYSDFMGNPVRVTTTRGDLFRHLTFTLLHEGASRTLFGVDLVRENRYMLASDWGVALTDSLGAVLDQLFPSRMRARALTRNGEGEWLVSTASGPVYSVRVQGDDLTVARFDSLRKSEDSILEWETQADVRWSRTARGIEATSLSSGKHWSWLLPEHVIAADIEPSVDGGCWIGTDEGLWRVSPTGIFPARLPGLANGAVHQVFDLRRDEGLPPNLTGRLLVRMGEKVFACSIPESGGVTRAVGANDSVRVTLWREGPATIGTVGVREAGERVFTQLPFRSVKGALALVALPSIPRGRQHLEVVAIDASGRPTLPAVTIRRTVRQRDSTATLTSVVLPALCLVGWALNTRRRRRSLVVGALAAIGSLLVLHQVLLVDVAWAPAMSLSGSVLLAGFVLRKQHRSRQLPPDEALHRLDELVRGFRHLGTGSNPVFELLVFTRNVRALEVDSSDLEREAVVLLRNVVDSTEDLAREGPALAEACNLEPLLLERFLARLQELRAVTLDMLESRWKVREWLQDDDRRLASRDVGNAFLQATERVSEMLSRHRRSDLERVVAAYVDVHSERFPGTLEYARRAEVGSLAVSELKLSEVLDNLLGNAAKAMEGSPNPRVSIGTDRRNCRALLTVDDAGPGVPPALRERIFERDFTTGRGTGFGLTRCREIVTCWGGEIRCTQSAELGGARFEIEIPLP